MFMFDLGSNSCFVTDVTMFNLIGGNYRRTSLAAWATEVRLGRAASDKQYVAISKALVF